MPRALGKREARAENAGKCGKDWSAHSRKYATKMYMVL